jgi:DNA-binding LytR/AlgR family response regulator
MQKETDQSSRFVSDLRDSNRQLVFACCDDEETYLELLKQAIVNWGNANSMNVEIESIADIDALVEIYKSGNRHDLIFLDIYFENSQYNGYAAAKLIRQMAAATEIVFISYTNQFILEGYDVAVKYFVKPFVSEEIIAFLQQWNDKNKREKENLLINSHEGMLCIPKADIVYIESDNHSIHIHTGTGLTHKCTMSLKAIDDHIKGSSIVKCHRAFLVNLEYVQKISGNEITTKDGHIVPLSRSEKENVLKQFISYKSK